MKKTILLATILFCVKLILAQTLVASYPFNGNANDAVGGANGTVFGATITTDRFGNTGRAYNFNGTSDYIEAAADNLPTGNSTISLWFNADAGSISTNRPGVLGYGGNSSGFCPGNSHIMVINLSGTNKYTTQAHCLNNYAEYTYPSPPENNWYNWTITINGTTIKMYVNGVLVSTTNTFTQPIIVAGKKLSIGAIVGTTGLANYTDPNVGRFKGKIDDVKIYNGAMTDAQVADNYNKESLAAFYPFSGNANDASGNNNTGTVNSATLTTDRFGNANSAYNFTTASNIEVGTSAFQLGISDYSLAYWVKTNAADAVIMGKGPHTLLGMMQYVNGDGTVQCRSEYPAGVVTSSIPINNNLWHQVVFVRSGTTAKIFIDGVLNTTSTVPLSNISNAELMSIGHSGANPFSGQLDDVKIYNIALTAQNIFDGFVNDIKKPGSGNSLLFTSQYVDIGNGWDPAGSFSFETWVKRTSTAILDPNNQVLICSMNDNGFNVGINQSAPANKIMMGKVGVSQVNSTSEINDTKWHHVAVTFNSTTNQVIFYIDGVADAPISYNPGGFNSGNSSYRIGARDGLGFGNYLNGSLDETRVWDGVVLTQTQIRDWMCKKINATHSSYINLKGYFRFDEGINLTVGGYNSKFGTLINTPTWQTSGAPIGDATAHDYVNAIKTTNISHPTGENFSVTSTSGSPSGIQVYRIDEQPNTLTGASGVGVNNKYFGVFQAGGTSPQYSAVYNYNGNSSVTAIMENQLRLNKRNDNAITSWTVLPDVANEPANTITVTGQSTEYILGRVGGVLPINLISFGAVKKDNNVVINWITTNEINVSHFELEKSIDGYLFTTLANTTAKGSASQNSYQTIDNNPFNGINFYRLKIFDTDDKYTYSQVVKIDFSKKYSINIWPNPAHDFITINDVVLFSTIEIIDVNGKVVKRMNKENTNRYSIAGISSGFYLVRCISSVETILLKLIIE
jgi:hypothetical protein